MHRMQNTMCMFYSIYRSNRYLSQSNIAVGTSSRHRIYPLHFNDYALKFADKYKSR